MKDRTLKYTDNSIGSVFTQPEHASPNDDYTYLGPAQGTITVPSDVQVYLRIMNADLAHIDDLPDVGYQAFDHINLTDAYDLNDSDIELFVSPLTWLKGVDLPASPEITNVGLMELRGMTQLQVLTAFRTSTTNHGLKVLRRMPKLRVLDIAHTQVVIRKLNHIQPAYLPNLRSLSIAGTGSSDLEIRHLESLGTMDQLYDLDLSWNPRIGNETVSRLCELPNLRHINIAGTSTAVNCARRIKDGRPELDIYFPLAFQKVEALHE